MDARLAQDDRVEEAALDAVALLVRESSERRRCSAKRCAYHRKARRRGEPLPERRGGVMMVVPCAPTMRVGSLREEPRLEEISTRGRWPSRGACR